MVRIYGPTSTDQRGGIVTMNLYDPDGHLLDYRRVEELAGERSISLRTGCFCNPGAGEAAEGITDEDVEEALAATSRPQPAALPAVRQPHRAEARARSVCRSASPATSPTRTASSNSLTSLRDQTRLTIGEVTFDIESCRIIRDGS